MVCLPRGWKIGKWIDGQMSPDERPGSSLNLQGLRSAIIERHNSNSAETNYFKELKPFPQSNSCEYVLWMFYLCTFSIGLPLSTAL